MNSKLKFLTLGLLTFFSTSAMCADQLGNVPRRINPGIQVNNHGALNAYLITLVEEYEGEKVNPKGEGGAHLQVYEPSCRNTRAGNLRCQADYLQDRWNGTMVSILKVSNGVAVELVRATFDGNF